MYDDFRGIANPSALLYLRSLKTEKFQSLFTTPVHPETIQERYCSHACYPGRSCTVDNTRGGNTAIANLCAGDLSKEFAEVKLKHFVTFQFH